MEALFPITTHAWRRLKLTIAEGLILSVHKGDHSCDYSAGILEAADAVRSFRDLYYPAPPRS